MRCALALCLTLSVGPFGCSGRSVTSGFGSGDDGGADGSLPLGGDDSGALGGDANAAADSSSGCSDAAKLVYVIDEQGGLHSFDPSTLTFKDIGTVNCQGANGTNSMAIDRSAVAWVGDNDGNLFKVSTSDASCQATAFAQGQHGFGKFGMGFSTDTTGGTTEKLYIDGIGGSGLAWIDLTSMKLNPIGQFDGALNGYDCELTGTGDARLFGFFTNQPASVAQIDKTSAHIISNVSQPGVSTGTDWAFSFWGGDFYLYTADTSLDPFDTTNVTRYRPSDGSTTVALSQIGFRIVGAGVSTCAPTGPVK
jgi:hypothetical protein